MNGSGYYPPGADVPWAPWNEDPDWGDICPACDGAGKYDDHGECRMCEGSGRVPPMEP